MLLEVFNDVDRQTAIDTLRPCVDIGRWCESIADGRPYASVDELVTAADAAAAPFSAEEIEGALAHHPRIGERARGDTAEATMSRNEQAGLDPDDAIRAALSDGNLAYEQRFGRVFLIRAAGRSAGEMVALLTERLEHSAEEEDLVVAQQLREIAVLRLKGIISR
ncbi:2-oxo-4-hydroxy-4-carboxy-5-ureidoimidazoline decarboxylase [Agromyces subbeticus]|uniref:2-oxo-4-hydroxy-4-carboxy-5-ureidoimidazoline decarboxylase n=1 Tax=Agromyces subbeticus TaxID=293890 RepID=UPI0003B73E0D|nr:2-oxo-4-hydroxy-4-carboxy-5-ureidoimidazoline decarboxylase [Agromyces subbeticus]